MNRLLLSILILAMVLAACDADPGPPDVNADWCYRFDFQASNSFNAIVGSWGEGVGYVTTWYEDDGLNRLSLSYGHTSTVSPLRIVIEAARVDAGDISVAANGIIFGLSGNTQQNFPAVATSGFISFDAQEAGLNGNSANVSVVSTGAIAVRNITIYGPGANPFGTSNCGNLEPTATDFIPTNTAFPTITPTGTSTETPTDMPTATPSDTPTPTNTIEPTWCYQWDFTVDDGGWNKVINPPHDAGYGVYTPGVGWEDTLYHGEAIRGISIERTFDTVNITQIHVVYDVTMGGSGAETPRGFLVFNGGTQVYNSLSDSNLSGTNLTITGNMNVTATYARFYLVVGNNSGSGDPGGTGVVKEITMRGTGISPFGDNCSPTPTPSPTNTATATPSDTPEPTFTPEPATATLTRTPLPTWTPIQAATGTINPSRTPYIPPTIGPTQPPPTQHPGTATERANMTATAYSGTATAIYETGTPNPSGTPWGTPAATGTPLVPGTLPAPECYTGAESICDTIGSGSNFFSRAFSWVGDLGGQFFGLINTWNNTAAAAPPGMPNCGLLPQQNELCAIYYILTFTLLSGPVGALLIPVAVVVIDLFILVSFIQMGRAILARIAEIQKGQGG